MADDTTREPELDDDALFGNFGRSPQILEHFSSTEEVDSSPRTAINSTLRPSPFLHAVVRQVRERIKAEDFHCFARSRLAKFWFGPDDSIHYELWLHERTSQLEIGLHLESSPATNRAIFERLDRCLIEIQSQLGQSFWLEEWDKGWARLYETQPLWPLDETRVSEVSSRICQAIRTIQPIYESVATHL